MLNLSDRSKSHLKRAAMLLAVALPISGCGTFDGWFGEDKKPLPGKRDLVFAERDPLALGTAGTLKVTLPAPAAMADWPQAGGRPDHDDEHPAAAATLSRAWTARIGASGGYRAKITAQPVVANGRVFTMDSDAGVSGFDALSGRGLWSVETQAEDNRSTNVGGGISVDGETLYVATGRADLLALDVTNGKTRWRVKLPNAARSAPTVGDGRLYVSTLDSQVLAYSVADGSKLWTHQAMNADTSVLGLPAPAFADATVVAGFGSGDLVALRAATGSVAWLDSLAAAQGRTSISEFSAITGMPVIKAGRVVATGLGRQLVAIDLRSGRRLWERNVASTETPWVAGDWIFVLASNNVLAAVSRQEGLTAWTVQLPSFKDMEKKKDMIHWTGPALLGDRLVVAGTNGEALSISPYTGEVLGKQALPGPIAVAPLVAGGTLYVVTDDATLTALR